MAGLLFVLGSVFASDAQGKSAGILIIVGGLFVSIAVVFIHWRHTFLDKRLPAVVRLVVLTALAVGFTMAGVSSLYFDAVKNTETFNTIIGTRFFNAPQAGLTAFLSAAFLPNETVVHPINQLLYVQINNRTNVPRRIAGISIESAERKWWWPSWAWEWPTWSKLCPVELKTTHLVWAAIDLKNASEIADKLNFERMYSGKSLAPNETASGWMAWECPKGTACLSSKLRIGIADTSGSTSWQVIDEPPVAPTMQMAPLRLIRQFDLSTIPLSLRSSCR
jgi:hypothetical protein